MATFSFELVSPEQLLLSIDAEQVTVPGTEGDFGVFVGHTPMIASLRSGVVEVEGPDGPQRIYIAGGMADVLPDRMTVLAEEAIPVADLDRAGLEQKIQNAREDLEDAKDDEARRIAEAKLSHLQDMLAAA
jgi:F-type H+-transporting ATPase subunit epsilon